MSLKYKKQKNLESFETAVEFYESNSDGVLSSQLA